MKNNKSFNVWAVLLWMCFILAFPLFLQGNFAIHAKAANDEKVYISTNKRLFQKSVLKNETFQIKIIDYGKRLKPSTLKFSSSDESIASVDSSGQITTHELGKAKIKVYTKKWHHYLCTFTVKVQEEIPRILFIGDSRSVYMFNRQNVELCGDIRDGMYVYARGGAQASYVKEVINAVDPNTYDTVVTWMGANDRGQFKEYKKYYKKILRMNKKMVVCTVGPVKDALLDDIGKICFNSKLMEKYNHALDKWADENDVYLVDLYDWIFKKRLKIDSNDGVHYLPRPTKRIWRHIIKHVEKAGVVIKKD